MIVDATTTEQPHQPDSNSEPVHAEDPPTQVSRRDDPAEIIPTGDAASSSGNLLVARASEMASSAGMSLTPEQVEALRTGAPLRSLGLNLVRLDVPSSPTSSAEEALE